MISFNALRGRHEHHPGHMHTVYLKEVLTNCSLDERALDPATSPTCLPQQQLPIEYDESMYACSTAIKHCTPVKGVLKPDGRHLCCSLHHDRRLLQLPTQATRLCCFGLLSFTICFKTQAITKPPEIMQCRCQCLLPAMSRVCPRHTPCGGTESPAGMNLVAH